MYERAEVFNEDPSLNETVRKGIVISLNTEDKTVDLIPLNLSADEMLGLLFAVSHVDAQGLIEMAEAQSEQ